MVKKKKELFGKERKEEEARREKGEDLFGMSPSIEVFFSQVAICCNLDRTRLQLSQLAKPKNKNISEAFFWRKFLGQASFGKGAP